MVQLTETGGAPGGEGQKGFFVSHIKFQVLLGCDDRAVRGAEEAKSGVLGRGQNQEIYPWRSTEYGWA